MRLATLLLFLAFALLIIGLYEMVILGSSGGYWAITLALALFFYYQYRKSGK